MSVMTIHGYDLFGKSLVAANWEFTGSQSCDVSPTEITLYVREPTHLSTLVNRLCFANVTRECCETALWSMRNSGNPSLPPEAAGRPRATPRRLRRPANQPKGLGKTTVASGASLPSGGANSATRPDGEPNIGQYHHATWRSFEMINGRTELGRPLWEVELARAMPAGSCPALIFVDYRAAVAPNSSYRVADN